MKRLLFCGLLAVILALGGATVPRLQREGVASTLDTSGIAWLQSLPLDEWQRIDNGDQGIERVRWLFDSIINQARIQMALEADGGAFELVLRRYIFYFHPEYEYWFPPYPDFDKGLGNPIEEEIESQVKWPVWVKKKKVSEGKPYDEYYVIHLGRKYDDERDIYIKFKDGKLYNFKVMRWKYLPEVGGLPKIEELKIQFDTNRAEFTRTYYNNNRSWEVYRSETLAEFGKGSSSPVDGSVDGDGSINGEPALDISGVEDLFTYPVDDWEREARLTAFQKFRSLINLCRLQFGLTEDGGEFEKYLRKDFFYYYPWEPWYESVDVERKPLGPAVRKFREEFEFDVGGEAGRARTLWITFLKDYGNPAEGYDWGIAGIKYERFVDTGVRGVPGTEERIFWFDFDLPTPKAYYDVIIKNPDGTTKNEQRIAEFTLGNPNPTD